MRKGILLFFVSLTSFVLFVTACSGDSKKTSKNEDRDKEAVKVTAAGEMPIVEEKIELDVLINGAPNIEDFETNEFTKWYEEQTNVKLNFEVVAPKNAQEQLNIILTGEDLPDVIVGFGISPTQQIVYGQQGLFIPLNDMINKYGHGTKTMFEEIEGAEEVITAPDGNIYGLPQIGQNPHTFFPQKLWIYEPWLDKLGLDMPTTTDQFYEVLKAFKTEDPNGNGKPDEIPLASAITGWSTDIDNFLMNAFTYTNKGDTNSYLFVEEGKIDVSFTQPGWKEGLKYFNKLYEEGLLAPESFTQDLDQLRQVGENPDNVILGAAPGGTMEFTSIHGESGRWKDYVTVPPLEGPDGLRIAPTSLRVNVNAAFVITSAAEYPEVAFRWADFMYTEEATLRNDQGVLDEHWAWAEEGEIGMNGEQARWKQIADPSSSAIQNREWDHTGPILNSRKLWEGLVIEENGLEDILYRETTENYQPYGEHDDKFVPPLFFNESQASELATLDKEIRDYVSGMLARFTIGDADVETEWDSYLETLEQMNLERFLEIHQEAYDEKYK